MDTQSQCRNLSLNEPLIGTAANSHHLMIVDQARPWKSKIQDSLHLNEETQSILDSWRQAGQSFTLLANATTKESLGLSHRFSWTAGKYVPDPKLEADEAVWLVCTHGSRDSCCGTLGVRLAQQLRQLNIGQVWEVSHIGGHRFAPTLWHLPSWRVYGRLPENSLELSNWVSKPLGTQFLRGHAGYSAKLQVFEAYLFEQNAQWPLNLQILDGQISVQWSERQESWQVEFHEQQQSGFQSCRDIAPGTVGNWTSYRISDAKRLD
jgi:hypothetical protein